MTFIDLFYLEMWPMFSGEKRKTKPVELLQDLPLENVMVLIYALLFLVLNKTTYVENNP